MTEHVCNYDDFMNEHVCNYDDFMNEHVCNYDDFMSEHVCNYDDFMSEHVCNYDDFMTEHVCNYDDFMTEHVCNHVLNNAGALKYTSPSLQNNRRFCSLIFNRKFNYFEMLVIKELKLYDFKFNFDSIQINNFKDILTKFF